MLKTFTDLAKNLKIKLPAKVSNIIEIETENRYSFFELYDDNNYHNDSEFNKLKENGLFRNDLRKLFKKELKLTIQKLYLVTNDTPRSRHLLQYAVVAK